MPNFDLSSLAKITPKPDTWKRPRIKSGKMIREIRRDAAYEELKKSVGLVGFLAPLLVMEDGSLFGGFHRLAVGDDLGIEDYPVRVYPMMPEEAVTFLATIDNLTRTGITPQEQTKICRELELAGVPKGVIATNLSKSGGWVTAALAIYDCPPEAQEGFWEGDLTHAQAYKIKTSDQPAVTQRLFLKKPPGDDKKPAEPDGDLPPKKTGKPVSKIELKAGSLAAKGPKDMVSLIALLKDALKSAEKADADGLTLRSYTLGLKDKAKAKPKVKKMRIAKNGDEI